MADLSRLCIHTITTKPWSLEKAVERYQELGIGGISVWQDATKPLGLAKSADLLAASDLEIVSYVRGGFFPAASREARESSLDSNRQMIEESAALGAPMLVLVCGAEPTISKTENETHIRDGIEALLPLAERQNVVLGIEPLHPMYADTRSAINTLQQATDLATSFASPYVQVVFDVYHLWWDPNLYEAMDDCFDKEVFAAYHICDWKVPTNDFLTDRGIMGEGCIDLKLIDSKVTEHGFNGFLEVEIFSEKYWAMDQDVYLDKIIAAYNEIY